MNSPLHVYALCVLLLFGKMLAISCYQGFYRIRHRVFTNAEDARFFQRPALIQELPQVQRAGKAWANDLENIPLFFVLGGLCLALDADGQLAPGLFCLFTSARVMHTLMYLGGWQPWRTIAYGLGLACLLAMAGLVAARIFPAAG